MMGCRDPKQRQLSFVAACGTRRQSSTPGAMGPPTDTDEVRPSSSAAAIMVELRAGIQAIDAHHGALSDRFDYLSERLDSHATRIKGADHRISKLDDGNAGTLKRLERMERILKTIAANNEDLEAQSCSNDLCITGLAETTNTGSMDLFVEKLITELFGKLVKDRDGDTAL
ncbi:hypothetical protein NDU88_003569 [Pleurodeles waltl]|uniref:Uncharacterized protein n=1 Tax=Pleurodeles waltl TaxID=8319 RepID=A0AAV7QCG8_PLEWA|nr:hypothetical protein NDU88_003569 [Pleurodeles waltl]